jgi:hypothetical protein
VTSGTASASHHVLRKDASSAWLSREAGDIFSDMSDESRRGMGRWAVVIPGALSADALSALEEHQITKQLLAGWAHGVPEPNTMVLVHASGETDAIGRVQRVLAGHGDFSGFEATEY